MFGGFIENSGTLRSVHKKEEIWEIEVSISADFSSKIIEGRSIAVNGVCLTVISFSSSSFSVECSAESWERTAFSSLDSGAKLNLELPLSLSTFLDGHLVQGHVDTVGEVLSVDSYGKNLEVEFSFPVEYAALLVEKGSVAIDGISLTCFQLTQSSFKVTLIPHTLTHTSLEGIQVGKKVNLEFDIVGKYLQRGRQCKSLGKKETEQRGELSMESLLKSGFI